MMAMDGMYNCYLNFDNVRVPVATVWAKNRTAGAS